MRRVHGIELHEQPWFPRVWRELFQLSLGRVVSLIGPFKGAIEPFRALCRTAKPTAILELASGSGELSVSFWKDVCAESEELDSVPLILSDLFPNRDAYHRFVAAHPGRVECIDEPVDALDPPAGEDRVWMMLEGLHHFTPDELRTLFGKATERAAGFVAFETTQRSWKNIALVLLTAPTTVFITSCLVRPFRWRNLLWGLLLPVVPFTMVFDGVMSNLRSYTHEELWDLVDSAGEGFSWRIEGIPAPGAGGLEITCIFGVREEI